MNNIISFIHWMFTNNSFYNNNGWHLWLWLSLTYRVWITSFFFLLITTLSKVDCYPQSSDEEAISRGPQQPSVKTRIPPPSFPHTPQQHASLQPPARTFTLEGCLQQPFVPDLFLGVWRHATPCTHKGEGNSTPLQCSCLGTPMDRGARQATVHGVAKNRTQLSD